MNVIFEPGITHILIFSGVLPGDFGFLLQEQQKGLGVDEDGPAWQTEEQQDQDTPLHNLPNTLQIFTAKRLRTRTDTQVYAFMSKRQDYSFVLHRTKSSLVPSRLDDKEENITIITQELINNQ